MNKFTRFGVYFFSILIFVFLGWWGNNLYTSRLKKYPDPISIIKQKPLEKYTIENLSKTKFKPSKINIDNNIFDFRVGEKKVTGLINLPENNELKPIVILIRGYVDQSIYITGTGTKRVGEFFSDNGYITLAPDFLGYGESDSESSNIFEARFQTYTTILTLLASINKENFPKWDEKNIFIWGHSNGGQIAIIILEITEAKYPTVLWAPVTESFPYSVLFYTNESKDQGKFIRKELAKFELEYNVDKYSLTNYLDRIKAPIEYHYGTSDDAIPSEWRDKFVKQMKDLKIDFINYNHSLADHNMNPVWSDVIRKTFLFFENQKN